MDDKRCDIDRPSVPRYERSEREAVDLGPRHGIMQSRTWGGLLGTAIWVGPSRENDRSFELAGRQAPSASSIATRSTWIWRARLGPVLVWGPI